jgi:hypothetical protein
MILPVGKRPRHRTSRTDESEKDLGAANGNAINPKISFAKELAALYRNFASMTFFG